MPRGGPRPGAGAPRGNLNAIRHGRHSPRLHALVDHLAQVPQLRDIFLDFRRHELRKQRRARRLVKSALAQLLLSYTNLTPTRRSKSLDEVGPHPDPEINQAITQLLARIQASAPVKNAKNKQPQAQTIKHPIQPPESLS